MPVDPAADNEFEDVTQYLSWDHDGLESMLTEVTHKVDAGELDEALKRCRDWDQRLVRHIRIEEELLFPLFDARAGIVAGPTAALREEHREIRRAVRIMRDGLAQRDPVAFRQGLAFLRSVLPGHNSKEEHLLFPATDRLLSDSERRALSGRLQRE